MPSRSLHRRILSLCLGLLAAAIAAPAAAEPREFAIESGPLAGALDRFAETADVQIVYPAERVAGETTEGVSGTLEPEAALEQLLEGTGFAHRFTDPGTVVVSAGEGSQQLGAIDVEATATRAYSADGTATGIGEGYGLSSLESPVSASAVDEQLLEEQGATRLRETVRNVPGVNFAGTYLNNYDNFRVRGFEVGRTGGGYLRNGDSGVHLQQPSFFPVQRVEVLRGPASILEGSVNPGGVINVQTYQPAETPIRRVSAGVDTFGQYSATANVGGPIHGTDGAAYRVVAGVLDGHTFKDQVEESERTLYGTLRWPLGEVTDLNLTVETQDREDVIDSGVVATDPDDPLGAARQLPRSRFLGEAVDSEYDNDHLKLELATELGAWDASLAYDYSEYRRVVKQVRTNDFGHDSPFVNDDGRTVRRYTNAFVGEQTWQKVSAEIRRSFTTGAVEHRLGLDASYRLTESGGRPNSYVADFGSFDGDFGTGPGDNDAVDPIDLFEPEYGGATPFDFAPKRDTALSHFAGVGVQDAMRIGERWVVLAGLRYDEEVDRDSDEETDAWSPRLGAVYRTTPSWSVYASYAESFEPISGVNDRTGERWDPAQGEQLELGTKLDVLRDASITASVFELRRVNALVEDPNNPNFDVQGGERRSRGLELELAGRVSENLDLRAGYSYLDTEIVSADFNEGNEFGDTPSQTFNVWAGYRLEPRLRVGGGVFYTGERFSSDSNDLELPSYTVVDVFARYRLNESTRVQFNVDNVFDEKYFADAGGFAYPGATGLQFGEPMTARFTLTHEF